METESCCKTPKVSQCRVWELPNNETGPGIPLPPQSEPLTTVRHTITKYRINGLRRYKPRALKGRWCRRDELESLPITAAHRKLLRRLPALNEQHKQLRKIVEAIGTLGDRDRYG